MEKPHTEATKKSICHRLVSCLHLISPLILAADLGHLRVVKPDKHNAFAEENDMFSFHLSAKTGDNVNSAFVRIAADLAGVVLSRPEIEVATVSRLGGGPS
jgi:hypothetical protein